MIELRLFADVQFLWGERALRSPRRDSIAGALAVARELRDPTLAGSARETYVWLLGVWLSRETVWSRRAVRPFRGRS